MILEPGSTARNNVVEGVIGEGGTAIVYRVRHRDLGSLHALKVLRIHGAGIARRLLLEGRSQATLRHPNIVPVTDTVDLPDGDIGLVMDLVDGPTLQELLRAGPPPVDPADAVARGILAGLEAAHARGLIHRDLKPANVLLDTSGGSVVPRIADFGLARVLDGAPDVHSTRAGAILGPPPYMAPEQFEDARSADRRADVFSAGALLYELLTGRRAFPGDQLDELAAAIRAGRFEPLPEAVPERMRRAVEGALQPHLEARLPDAAALLATWSKGASEPATWPRPGVADVRAILRPGPEDPEQPRRSAPSTLPISPAPSLPTPAPPAPPPARGRAWAAGGGIGLGLLVGAAGLWQALEGGRPAVGTPVEAAALTAMPPGAFVDALAVSEDGATLAWIEDGSLRLRSTVAGTPDQVPLDLPHAVVGMDLLPGGDLVPGQFHGRGGIAPRLRLDPRTGASTPLRWRGVWPRVDPEGARLAWSDDAAIWVATHPDGGPRRLHSLPSPEHPASLTWSPDGAWLLAAIDDFTRTRTEVRLLATDGSRSVTLIGRQRFAGGGPDQAAWLDDDRFVLLERVDEEVQLREYTVDLVAGTLSEPTTLHAWSAFGPRGLELAREQGTLYAILESLDQQVRILDRGRDGYGAPREVLRDRRPELVIGWLDPRRVLLYVRRETWDVVALDVVTGQSERWVDDEGDDGFGCVIGGELLIHSRNPATGLDLSWVRGGARQLAATVPFWPGGVHCAHARPDRVWLQGVTGAIEFLEPFDLAAATRGEPAWRSEPGRLSDQMLVSPDGRTAWIAVGAEVVAVDTDSGGRAAIPQPFLHPTLTLSHEGEPWVVGVVEGRTEVRRLSDGGLVLATDSEWYRPHVSPDGSRVAVHTGVGSSDLWEVRGLGR